VSLNEILSSAVSGLAASQAGLRTVSNNIANVSTPGYARERVTLTTSVTAGRVTGVLTGESERIADRFLEANAYRRASDVGRADVSAAYLDRLQSLLGAPGAASGLPARLDAIGASAIELSGSQASAQTRAVFTANVDDALNSLRQVSGDASQLQADTDSDIRANVDSVNALLTRIHDLNDSVAQLQGLGRNAAGPYGQRLDALEQLSTLLNVTVRDQPDGKVTIDTASGAVLLDSRLRQLSYASGVTGEAKSSYPAIDIRFANPDGSVGAATGTSLNSSAAAGGKIGALIDIRDRAIPAFTERLGVLFTGLSEALNAASNAGSTVPAPNALIGRQTGLIGADRLGFTGSATFAVVAGDGTLVARTSVDFTALGPGATIDDAIAAINTGLGGAGTASFTNGSLSISATAAGNGVAVAQDGASPSDRAGTGFSQYFGLNDIIRSNSSTLVPPGFTAADPTGFAPGQTADITLRDTSGRALATYTLTGSNGPSFGDLVTELNASPLASFGTFSIDSRGRFAFAGKSNVVGPSLTINADSTDRHGSGRSFSQLSGLSGESSGLGTAQVRADVLANVLANGAKLPLARLQTGAAIGEKALGTGDLRGAAGFSDQLARAIDLGRNGKITAGALAVALIGNAGADSSRANGQLADATARHDDAVNRRDSYSGVNVDEELSQLVVYQNSYSAAARVISAASDLYDTLLSILR
jgi:flagellar hook-associated protein 1 FlgK